MKGKEKLTEDNLPGSGTIGALIRERTGQHSDKVLLRVPAKDYTYREMDALTDRLASSFVRRGATVGTKIGSMLPSCAEFVIVWFASAKLGAVTVGINDAARANGLRHQLAITDTELLVVDETSFEAVLGLVPELPMLKFIAVRGSVPVHDQPARSVEIVSLEELIHEIPEPLPKEEFDEFDPMMILLTSGTTGMPKPCILSHHYGMTQADIQRDILRTTADDVIFSPFPVYHATAPIHGVLQAVLAGATAAIGRKFSVSGYWDHVREAKATITDFMGVSLALLWKAPESDRDLDNDLRVAWGEPIPEWGTEFEKRFGLKLLECYGSTQIGIPIYDSIDEEHRPRTCGKPVGPYELRICEPGTDNEVAVGQSGELHVKATRRGVLFDGYYGQPDATHEVFDGEWYRTGDLLSRDEDDHYYFVGRLHDAIRRRGEFISAFEIEQVIQRHETVQDVAVIAVKDKLSGEEAKACLVPQPGRTIDLVEIVDHCTRSLPGFMVPRYYEILAEIQKSEHGKMAKLPLRDAGITAHTWDRTNGAAPIRGARPE